MCIRDRHPDVQFDVQGGGAGKGMTDTIAGAVDIGMISRSCLLYTSDAADERSSVDLGGRRIIKKKKREQVDVDCVYIDKVTYIW